MRFIDAEAFEEELEDFSFGGISLIYDNPHDKMVARHTVSEVTYLLDRAPTIETKPVEHAHWEKMSPEKGVLAGATCSNCKVCAGYWDETMEEFDFCPYCGAQMDEIASDTNVGSKGVKIPVMSMKDICRKIMCDR